MYYSDRIISMDNLQQTKIYAFYMRKNIFLMLYYIKVENRI